MPYATSERLPAAGRAAVCPCPRAHPVLTWQCPVATQSLNVSRPLPAEAGAMNSFYTKTERKGGNMAP